jgi:hypothetical protein
LWPDPASYQWIAGVHSRRTAAATWISPFISVLWRCLRMKLESSLRSMKKGFSTTWKSFLHHVNVEAI